jgi:hypothetical protein
LKIGALCIGSIAGPAQAACGRHQLSACRSSSPADSRCSLALRSLPRPSLNHSRGKPPPFTWVRSNPVSAHWLALCGASRAFGSGRHALPPINHVRTKTYCAQHLRCSNKRLPVHWSRQAVGNLAGHCGLMAGIVQERT